MKNEIYMDFNLYVNSQPHELTVRGQEVRKEEIGIICLRGRNYSVTVKRGLFHNA